MFPIKKTVSVLCYINGKFSLRHKICSTIIELVVSFLTTFLSLLVCDITVSFFSKFIVTIYAGQLSLSEKTTVIRNENRGQSSWQRTNRIPASISVPKFLIFQAKLA